MKMQWWNLWQNWRNVTLNTLLRYQGLGQGSSNKSFKKEKNTKVKFNSYKKICNVQYTKSRSSPKKLTTGKWIEYHPSFQYAEKLFGCLPKDLRHHMRKDQRAYQESRGSNRNAFEITSSICNNCKQRILNQSLCETNYLQTDLNSLKEDNGAMRDKYLNNKFGLIVETKYLGMCQVLNSRKLVRSQQIIP